MCNYIENYLYEKEVINKRDPKSIKKYRTVLIEFFGEKPSKEQIESITAEYIVEWLDKLNNATSTKNQKLDILKSFWLYLNDEYDFRNVAKRIAHRKDEVVDNEEADKFLEKEDVDKLIATLHDNWHDNNYNRDIALIEVALYCGVRISEAAKITLADIDFENKELTVIGKRGKRRVVPMNDTLIATLEKYIRVERIAYDVFPISAMSISNMMKKWVAKAGLNQEYTYHSLRHTFCSSLWATGIDPKVIQTLMGHSSYQTTINTYTHVTRQSKHDAVNTLV